MKEDETKLGMERKLAEICDAAKGETWKRVLNEDNDKIFQIAIHTFFK